MLVIKVVQDPNTPRNLFRYGDKLFNQIEGIPTLLTGSSLLIVRNASVLDYTNTIVVSDNAVCFKNLHKLSQEAVLPGGDSTSVLVPEYFHVGDLIVITSAYVLSPDEISGPKGLLQNKQP